MDKSGKRLFFQEKQVAAQKIGRPALAHSQIPNALILRKQALDIALAAFARCSGSSLFQLYEGKRGLDRLLCIFRHGDFHFLTYGGDSSVGRLWKRHANG